MLYLATLIQHGSFALTFSLSADYAVLVLGKSLSGCFEVKPDPILVH